LCYLSQYDNQTGIEFDLDLHYWESYKKDLYHNFKSFPIEEHASKESDGKITLDDKYTTP
jgi:hypothetical protein